MNCYLLIDFGSTYTKLCLIDKDKEEIIGTSSAYTTIETSIKIGFDQAYSKLLNQINLKNINLIDTLACSSAGGGLKIVAIGVTPLYTVEAAKKSALGAGARILKCFNYYLKDEDLDEINELNPDIILLSGGAEGGNKSYIIENSKKLCNLKVKKPIVVAGNSYANEEIRKIFDKFNMEYTITDNLMPDVNSINPEPVRETIRKIFMKQIVLSKGMEEIENITKDVLMPTPTAVIKAAQLLSEGVDGEGGVGDVMVVDVGGATTDLHTISESLQDDSFLYEGIPEPYIKRTVEGDLGMRYSALSVLECVGENEFLKYNPNLKNIRKQCKYRHENPGIIMNDIKDLEFDEIIGKNCISVAVKRHSGTIRNSFLNGRDVILQKGKDLRNIKYIIGTGGIIINSSNKKELLKEAFLNEEKLLSPEKSELRVDSKYIISAMGLLSFVNKKLALKLLKENIEKI